MRVIGGIYRSRKLKSSPGASVRPTPDRLREALFSILSPRLEGCVFVDAYAGCGAVGIEALSRGASQAIFIEKSRQALSALRENLGSLQIGHQAKVIVGSAHIYLPGLRADIYFLDPPYERLAEYESCLGKMSPPAGAIVIAQHSKHLDLADEHPRLRRYRQLRQGDNVLSFYQAIA